MTSISDWRELPHEEIWVADSEFYPGLGFAHGGVEGDPLTPYCYVALELRSGRLIRLRQDQLGPFPPHRIDKGALIVAYMAAAEFGFYTACGWPEPACAIDAYVEFRHLTNNGALKTGERPKGYHSLAGALRYFHEDEIDTARKDEMRDEILSGGPFSAEQQATHLDYCEDDVRALARLVPHIVKTLRPPLTHAMFRAKYQWTVAHHQRRGIPLDRALVPGLRRHWDEIRCDLVTELDRPFGCYEIVGGVPHWRKERLAAYVRRHGMPWPTYDNGSLDERDETFKTMASRYPQLQPLRELRSTLSKLRLSALAVGNDGRNRAQLWAFGTKTGRNAPGASQYVFGPAKWLRFLITPPPGRALVHRDYSQQEVRIAAVLSGDDALLAACESGDVYLGVADQLGFLSKSLSDAARKAVRAIFKTVVLGVQYGLGPHSLALRTGISLPEACEILARLQARFCRFVEFVWKVRDRAGLLLEIGTSFGWTMQCPPEINPRTVRNFPMQSAGSEIMHAACVLAERRGIEIVATVHDAIMAESPVGQVEDVSDALDRLMADAAAIVLRGYRLPTDQQIIRPGERYFDDRGQAMWSTVTRLLTKLERETA